MLIQSEINFVHTHENNRESEAILEDNYDRLNKQCVLVLSLLKKGLRLTVRDAIINHGIGDLRARIRDLRNSGIAVNDTVLKGGCKEYYL